VIGCLSVMLAGSIAGNIIGYRTVYQLYDRYNDLRLDPLGTDHHAPESTKLEGWRLVLLGDSHAANWIASGDDVLNLGIGAQTSAQIRLRSDAVRARLSGRRLIVMAGGNDLKSISTNLQRKNAIVSNCLDALDAVLSNHMERFEEIVLVTIPPVFSMPVRYRLLHSDLIVQAHREINRGIHRLAVKRGVRLLDAYRILTGKMEIETLSTDGIHLNTAAYRYLEAALPVLD